MNEKENDKRKIEEKEKESMYNGESSRSAHERGSKHGKDLEYL